MACSGCAKRREAIRKGYLAAKHGFVALMLGDDSKPQKQEPKPADAAPRKGVAP